MSWIVPFITLTAMEIVLGVDNIANIPRVTSEQVTRNPAPAQEGRQRRTSNYATLSGLK